MSVYKPDPQLTSFGAHARNTWTCPCGKTCRGNGGRASHQRACRTYAEHTLAATERAIARIDAGALDATPRRARLAQSMRSTMEHRAASLRTRLGILPAEAE